MVDPVGGVGGVQDTEIFPPSGRGEAVATGGAGASACGAQCIMYLSIICVYCLSVICLGALPQTS